MTPDWLLLIYTVPATPSRKRAAIWREIKKAGAVYLRDGVCILPQREDTLIIVRTIAQKVDEFGGRATIAQKLCLDPTHAEAVISEMRSARAAEYREERSFH